MWGSTLSGMAEKSSFVDSAGREHAVHEISREEATERWVDAGMPMGPAPSVVVLDGKSYVPDSPDEVAGNPSQYSTGPAPDRSSTPSPAPERPPTRVPSRGASRAPSMDR